MSDGQRLAGVWPILVTPFDEGGEIDAEGLPSIVQDYPPETAVQLSAEAIAELLAAAGGRGGVKVEDPPTGPKIARLRALLGPDVGLVGGLGGMHLLGELRRGADGAMTGFPYPQALLQVCRAMAAGDEDTAEATFRRWLPLLVSCGLPGVGLAIMKEVLRRRGLIRHAGLRLPGPALDGVALRELDRVLADLPAVDEPLGATR